MEAAIKSMNKTAKRLYRYRRRLKLIPIDVGYKVIDPKKKLGEGTIATTEKISSVYWEHGKLGHNFYRGRIVITALFTPGVIDVTFTPLASNG